MIFDSLKKRERALVIGVLNGNARAYLQLSRALYGNKFLNNKITVVEEGSKRKRLPKRSVIRGLMGIPELDRGSGEHRHKFVDHPELKKNALANASAIKLIEAMREWPLEMLRAEFSPRLWRCDYCQDFFEAKDLRDRRYCSPECGHSQEAAKCASRDWASDRAEKLQRARDAQKLWPPDTDWKEFVAAKARVTKNFLTYAVRNGELRDLAPSGRRATGSVPLKSLSAYRDALGEIQELARTEPEERTKRQKDLADKIATATTRKGLRFSGEVVPETEIEGVGEEL